jgi:hypothetical protein
MTADVKSWLKIFDGFIRFAPDCSEEAEPVKTTVEPAELRGVATTLLGPLRCLPRARSEAFAPLHAVEGYTIPGLHLCRWTWDPSLAPLGTLDAGTIQPP